MAGIKVTLPYDPEWKPLEWAKENCSSYITNKAENINLKVVSGGWVCDTKITYFFSDEKDATAFILRWL